MRSPPFEAGRCVFILVHSFLQPSMARVTFWGICSLFFRSSTSSSSNSRVSSSSGGGTSPSVQQHHPADIVVSVSPSPSPGSGRGGGGGTAGGKETRQKGGERHPEQEEQWVHWLCAEWLVPSRLASTATENIRSIPRSAFEKPCCYCGLQVRRKYGGMNRGARGRERLSLLERRRRRYQE